MTGLPPRVSVVAATHNREARLAMLLDSLREQTLDRREFEVIIVDDASGDGTRELLARELERGDLDLRVLHLEANRGPGFARNQGWAMARGSLIAFTDDDCVAMPDWLQAGLVEHEREPGAIVQGRTDPLPSELHLMGPFSRTLEIHTLGPFFQTCNVFYPRSLLEDLGGFDGGSFSGPAGEDTDLAWRGIQRGAGTRFAGDAVIHHAVVRLGPIGYLRGASRWSESVQLFRRHPGLRRVHLHKRWFWHANHWLLFRVLLAMLLRRHLPLVVLNWLRSPYLANLVVRMGRRGGGPLIVPYLVLYDVLEMAAILRASAKYRTLVI
ncbi:MAG: glycosyltransferase family 2 protein [Thermoleophilaceae bacterium]